LALCGGAWRWHLALIVQAGGEDTGLSGPERNQQVDRSAFYRLVSAI